MRFDVLWDCSSKDLFVLYRLCLCKTISLCLLKKLYGAQRGVKHVFGIRGNGGGLVIGNSCDLFDLFSLAVYHLV